jgi:hypothetical protein
LFSSYLELKNVKSLLLGYNKAQIYLSVLIILETFSKYLLCACTYTKKEEKLQKLLGIEDKDK